MNRRDEPAGSSTDERGRGDRAHHRRGRPPRRNVGRTGGGMTCGVDTDFLVACEIVGHPFHAAANRLLRDLLGGEHHCALAPRTQAEFIHIVAGPRRMPVPRVVTDAILAGGELASGRGSGARVSGWQWRVRLLHLAPAGSTREEAPSRHPPLRVVSPSEGDENHHQQRQGLRGPGGVRGGRVSVIAAGNRGWGRFPKKTRAERSYSAAGVPPSSSRS